MLTNYPTLNLPIFENLDGNDKNENTVIVWILGAYCINFKRDVLWLPAKLILRIKLTWSNLST